MKKILFLGTFLMLSASISICSAAFNERPQEFYQNLSESEINFFNRLKTCSPATLPLTFERVYGKTKNNKCHYSFMEYNNGGLKEYHCMLPYAVSYGYATSSLNIINEYKTNTTNSSDGQDSMDMNSSGGSQNDFNAELATQQNNEIRKLLRDYCIIKTK